MASPDAFSVQAGVRLVYPRSHVMVWRRENGEFEVRVSRGDECITSGHESSCECSFARDELMSSKLGPIARALAQPGAGVTGDEFVDSRCVFCSAAREMDPPSYAWVNGKQVPLPVAPLEHEEGCIIKQAQSLVRGAELRSSIEKEVR